MGDLSVADETMLPDRDFEGGVYEMEELRLFKVGNARYLAMPLLQFPQIPGLGEGISALTIIICPTSQRVQAEWLKQQIGKWLEVDDVFRVEFLAGIVFANSGELSTHDQSLLTDVAKDAWGTKWCVYLPTNSSLPEMFPGPYALWNGKMCKVHRLFDDVNETFMVATKPKETSGPFENLHVSGDSYQTLSVAVPSRIGSCSEEKGLLHGLRFAVKDVFEIEGLRVTAGNRAFYSLSETSLSSAPSLQRLIDGGANLIGTLKLGSLIAREEPTESVDYHAAFNPRADGYQSAWSSSGGSGAAIAAYDFLDFTLGTDTTGSSRRPAMANGCFQFRVSQTSLPPERIVPSWPLVYTRRSIEEIGIADDDRRFDSPAMFGRDIIKMEKWIGAWIDRKGGTHDNLPVALVYLHDFLPIQNKKQMELIDSFIADVESVYGVKAQKVSIAETWKENLPAEAKGLSVEEYLKDVGVNSFCYGVYHCLKDFHASYQEKFGKEPYVNPVTRWRWDIAQTVSNEQYDDAVHRLDIYKEWLLKEVLQVGKQNAILLQPITNQEVDYREDPPGPPTAPKAFDSIWLAPVLGAPEVSVPIGELKYHSRISQRDEYLPVVLSLLGEPGSDMALLDATKRILEKSGRSTFVKTGSRMFS